MFTSRFIGACAVAATAVVAVAVAASIISESSSSATSPMPRGLASTDIGVPIAYDVQEPRPRDDGSVPSASTLRLQEAAGEPAPTF